LALAITPFLHSSSVPTTFSTSKSCTPPSSIENRDADNLPASFPIQRASALLDYDFTDVGGKPFLLPLRAEIRMLSPSGQNRNVVEFLGYRKFSGESSISFELKDK
jgi:hypothetical protein